MAEEIAGYESVVAYYRADTDIAAGLSEDQAKQFFTYDINEWLQWKEVVIYQGFNPRRIVRLMMENGRAYCGTATDETASVDVIVAGVPKTVTLSNKWTLMKDVQMIISIFGGRGATWKKLKDKSTQGLQQYLTWMEIKYNFDTSVHAGGTSLAPDLITIPRVIGCFPAVICQMYHKGIGKPIFPIGEICLTDAYAGSKAIMTPFFCSLIPRKFTKAGKGLHYFFFLVHVVIDNVIQKKHGNYTGLESIWTYYLAAYRSEATPEESRIKFCTSVGLIDNGQFIPDLVAANHASELAIRDLRQRDPNINQIMIDIGDLKD